MPIRDATLRTGASRRGAPAEPAEGAALDLTHLARQCLGDRDLMAELLCMFRTEAQRIAAELAGDGLSSAAQADIAHRLRGSALVVGASAVARAAEGVETFGTAAAQADHEGAGRRPVEMSQAIATLVEAVCEAAAEIARLEAGPPGC
jgi:HPt (histidine-containing phosphotransfer) domain-containing protein